MWDTVVVSPKLANSGNTFKRRFNPTAIQSIVSNYKHQLSFKFVAKDPSDLVEIRDWFIIAELDSRDFPVYIMPMGTDRSTLSATARDLIPHIIDEGWYLSPRLHIELFGKTRGV
ncbi:MAG: hypothetical protein HC888_04135 [Candidatus Competibacteraceae bacterium]|nr:hypothetical protein [Candidatus Competibacteraceae bacterium]